MNPARLRGSTAASLALAVSLVAAGCGSPAPSSDATGSTPHASKSPTAPSPTPSVAAAVGPLTSVGVGRQACALVTRQEVSTALAADPGAGKAFSQHGSSQCQFGSYQTGFVVVNLTPTQGVAAYDLLHSNRTPDPSMHVAEISGVGDRAFGITGPNTASIYFDKGDAMVLITVEIMKATSPPKTQVLTLAKAAAGRA